MQENGFLGACVFLVFCTMIISQQHAHYKALELREDAVLLGLASEQAEFERNALESNTDYLIDATLKRNLNQTTDPFELKTRIATELCRDFSVLERFHPNLQFSIAQVNPQNYAGGLEPPFTAVSPSALEKIISVFLISSERTHQIIQLEFTGGIHQNQVIGTIIKTPQYETDFLIPIHYSKTVIE